MASGGRDARRAGLGREGVTFALPRRPGRRRRGGGHNGETGQPDPAAAAAVVGVNDAAESGGERQGAGGSKAEGKGDRRGKSRNNCGQREWE